MSRTVPTLCLAALAASLAACYGAPSAALDATPQERALAEALNLCAAVVATQIHLTSAAQDLAIDMPDAVPSPPPDLSGGDASAPWRDVRHVGGERLALFLAPEGGGYLRAVGPGGGQERRWRLVVAGGKVVAEDRTDHLVGGDGRRSLTSRVVLAYGADGPIGWRRATLSYADVLERNRLEGTIEDVAYGAPGTVRLRLPDRGIAIWGRTRHGIVPAGARVVRPAMFGLELAEGEVATDDGRRRIAFTREGGRTFTFDLGNGTSLSLVGSAEPGWWGGGCDLYGVGALTRAGVQFAEVFLNGCAGWAPDVRVVYASDVSAELPRPPVPEVTLAPIAGLPIVVHPDPRERYEVHGVRHDLPRLGGGMTTGPVGEDLYVADGPGNAIRRWRGAIGEGLVSGPAAFAPVAVKGGELNDPLALAMGPDGTLYVAEGTGRRVVALAYDGTLRVLAGPEGFMLPAGLARARDGALYVADRDAHAIKQVAADGRVTAIAGGGGAGFADGAGAGARFDGPVAIAAVDEATLLVLDAGNRRVRRLTRDAGGVWTVATVAGTGAARGADGDKDGAAFRAPRALVADRAGNAYVADDGRVRRVAPDGAVATLAGTSAAWAVDRPAETAGLGDVAALCFLPGDADTAVVLAADPTAKGLALIAHEYPLDLVDVFPRMPVEAPPE